ncbi:MAG: hypothetical protein KUG69_12150 [Marinosulfonomonas sp.]|nr:hypothetical protein [Marinosulfonomonas sp.]
MPEFINTIAYSPLLWFAIAFWAVLWVLKQIRPGKRQPTFFSDKKWLNAVITFAIAFAPILALLFFAVLAMLAQTAHTLLTGDNIPATDLRWYALSFVGLLTALGGIIGTPLALIRVFTVERQTAAQETGLITDRISKSIDQLGHENTAVRIGAIHSLERIIVDSEKDRVMVMRTLNAYLVFKSREIDDVGESSDPPELDVDIQEALDLILRLNTQGTE